VEALTKVDVCCSTFQVEVVEGSRGVPLKVHCIASNFESMNILDSVKLRLIFIDKLFLEK